MPVVVYSTNPYLALNDKRDTGGGGGSLPAWSAGASEYMVTGSGSHEMQAQLIGEGTPTFDTPAGLLLPDHEGVYVEIPENTPPWHGARWDNGVAYSDDGAGAPLQQGVDDPTLDNRLLWSRDYSQGWGPTSTSLTPSEIGIDGTQNTGWVMEVTSAGANRGLAQSNRNLLVGGPFVLRWFVKYDGWDFLRVQSQGLDANTACWFDIAQGIVGQQDNCVGELNDVGGGWMELLMQGSTTSDTQGNFSIYAANGSAGSVYGTLGATYILGNADVFANSTLADIRGKSAMVTEGATGGTPTKIGQFPSLYAAPEMTNVNTDSSDLTQASWFILAGTTATYDQVGLTGEPNTASMLDKTITTNTGYSQKDTGITPATATNTLRVYVKKDFVQTVYPNIQFNYLNGTAAIAGYSIDRATGEVAPRAGNSAVSEIAVDSVGDWWAVYIQSDSDGTQNVIRFFLHPAYTDTLGGESVNTLTGTTIYGNTEIFSGKTIAQVKGSAPIVTEGVAVTNTAIINSYDIANFSVVQGACYGEVKKFGDTDPTGSEDPDLVGFGAVSANALLRWDNRVRWRIVTVSGVVDTSTVDWSDMGEDFTSVGSAYDSVPLTQAIRHESTEWAEGVYNPALTPPAIYVGTGDGSPALNFPWLSRNIQIWDLPFDDAKAKIDELME